MESAGLQGVGVGGVAVALQVMYLTVRGWDGVLYGGLETCASMKGGLRGKR